MYKPKEFAKKIGVSVSTLRRWDKEKRLVPLRTQTNHRVYTDDDIFKVLNLKKPSNQGKIVVYCRVSNHAQKDDLQSQIEAMQTFCLAQGIAVDEWHSEVGSGLNFKRKIFLSLMDRIEIGEIKNLYVAHKDRLARFGFDYFEHMANRHNCQIIVANQEKPSPQQELVEDMLAIIHGFSNRLYGLKKYKKQIKQMVKENP